MIASVHYKGKIQLAVKPLIDWETGDKIPSQTSYKDAEGGEQT